jgi:putative ABC transport system permease protein
VLKDFHLSSLQNKIYPLVISYSRPEEGGKILIRTERGKTSQAIAGLSALSRELNPAFPFTYTFTEEAYQRLYKSEAVVQELARYFAGLAIAISCLGLLGLVIFTAEQRLKEIGIRKVLGAGTGSIFGLLSKEFMSLVGLSILLATPLAWWGLHEWLKGYAYHVSLDWITFLWPGLLVLLIALATISYQSIRAALVNPVKSLRSE